jgi:nucleoside-diphosphate kinase
MSETTNEYKGLEERTLVVVKPDGVKRGLIGEIISRFEKAGLKVIGLKLITVEDDFARRHYPGTEDWIRGMGEKTLDNYKKYEIDPIKEVGTDDPLKIGYMIYDWNVDAFTSGPVVAIALEGNHAVDNVRMVVGPTLPSMAQPGTIRGDFSSDSAALANKEKRAIKNVVHASGEIDEAQREISHWFGPEDIVNYVRADQQVMFAKD